MGLLDKVTDPLGIKKKAKKKLGITRLEKKMGLDDLKKFEEFNLKRMWDMIREDPERILLGAGTPLTSKMWSEITGDEYEAMVNMWGGPTAQAYADAEAAGIDTSSAQGAHQVAQMIASIYAGGAGAQGLGAAGIGGGGATATGALSSAPGANVLASGLTKTGMALGAGAQSAASEFEEPPVYPEQIPFDPRYMGMMGLGRTFGYGPMNPYGAARGGEVMTYARGGQAKFDEARDMIEDISQMAKIPGALEMLTTTAADELGVNSGKTSPVRLYKMGGSVNGYQQGGLSQIMQQQAGEVAAAGRGDDEMIVHMAPEEFEAIQSMWGPAQLNPQTGMPEYGFLSKLWKGIKKTVKKIVKSPLFSFIAPIALNVFAPGLGSAIGGWLGATGKAAATIGNTLLRSGIGAISGGKEGAISGALSGLTGAGVGKDIGTKLGLEGATAKVAGDALLGGVAGEATGVGFSQGAIGQGMASIAGQPLAKAQQGITERLQQEFDPLTTIGMDPDVGMSSPVAMEAQADPFGLEGLGSDQIPIDPATGQPAMSPIPQTPQTGMRSDPLTVLGDPIDPDPSLWDRGVDWVKENPLLAGGAALGAMYLTGPEAQGQQGPPSFELPPGWDDPFENLSYNREQLPIADYYTYGQTGAPFEGEGMFFSDATFGPVDPPGTGPLPGLGGGSGRGPRGRGGRRRPAGGRRALPQYDDAYGGVPPGGALPEPNYLPGTGDAAIPQNVIQLMEMGRMGDSIYGNMMRRLQEKALAQYYPGYTYDEFFPRGAARGGFVDMDQTPHSMQMQYYALGGLVKKYQAGGHVAGQGTGRSDEIPAMLSDGEYVMDAETVALLGDGSTNAGAAKLDKMRKNLRKHKGGGLAKGRFSADAKEPEQYLAEGGAVAGSKTAFRELKRLATRLERAITSGNKKRVKEITQQLKGMDRGKEVVVKMSKGGSLKRILASLETEMDVDTSEAYHGPTERRVRAERRRAEREGGRRRRLSDKDRAELVEELGGFTPKSTFMRRFRAQLKEKGKEGE